jgi:hypothetical protein
MAAQDDPIFNQVICRGLVPRVPQDTGYDPNKFRYDPIPSSNRFRRKHVLSFEALLASSLVNINLSCNTLTGTEIWYCMLVCHVLCILASSRIPQSILR